MNIYEFVDFLVPSVCLLGVLVLRFIKFGNMKFDTEKYIPPFPAMYFFSLHFFHDYVVVLIGISYLFLSTYQVLISCLAKFSCEKNQQLV